MLQGYYETPLVLVSVLVAVLASYTALARILADCNARVVQAPGAREALQLLGSDRPDVLVSDIGMPDVDGYALIREVRRLADPALSRVPSVALTAFTREDDERRALSAGFDAFLSKPVDTMELVELVRGLARRRDVGHGDEQERVRVL
jgi:diguanylate cyclase